jgi:hypothetical protein
MSTFLKLCQDVAKDSGTVSTIGQPQTTTGQTGRLLRIMGWVTEAYEDIQSEQNAWRWMQADFSGPAVATVQEYNAEALGITERFSRWVIYGEDEENLFTIYKTALGQSDEGFLTYVDWPYFRRNLLVGSAATRQDKPVYFTVDNTNQLRLWPTPDDAYTIRGVYHKAPQTLADDGDIPEMPEEFHDTIKWLALMKLGVFDEAFNQLPSWTANYGKAMSRLIGHQLPPLKMQSTLA